MQHTGLTVRPGPTPHERPLWVSRTGCAPCPRSPLGGSTGKHMARDAGAGSNPVSGTVGALGCDTVADQSRAHTSQCSARTEVRHAAPPSHLYEASPRRHGDPLALPKSVQTLPTDSLPLRVTVGTGCCHQHCACPLCLRHVPQLLRATTRACKGGTTKPTSQLSN